MRSRVQAWSDVNACDIKMAVKESNQIVHVHMKTHVDRVQNITDKYNEYSVIACYSRYLLGTFYDHH